MEIVMFIFSYVAFLIVLCASGLVLSRYGSDGYDSRHFLALMSGLVSCGAAALGAAIGVCVLYSWVSAETRAAIVNREYGTSYTQSEIFYAEDIIDTIRQIKRTRIEATVNVNTDK